MTRLRKIARKLVNIPLKYHYFRKLIRPLVRCKLIPRIILRETPFNDVVRVKISSHTFHYHLEKGDSFGSWLWWYGNNYFEPESTIIAEKIFKKINCFWDVGAHTGGYSLLAAVSNPNLIIHAFEPAPNIFKKLRENLALNHFASRVTCHEYALGHINSTEKFHFPTEAQAEASFVPGINRPFTEILDIILKKGDDLEIEKPQLIKIDTEGFEPQVLEGLKKILKEDKPMIICEILQRADIERIQFLLKDYSIFRITSNGLEQRRNLQNKNRVHKVYENYLFVPRKPEFHFLSEL